MRAVCTNARGPLIWRECHALVVTGSLYLVYNTIRIPTHSFKWLFIYVPRRKESVSTSLASAHCKLSTTVFPVQELNDALYQATWKGHVTIAALLMSNGAHITKQTFLAAIRNEDFPIFQEFLNHGWDINSTEFGDPALRCELSPSRSCLSLLTHPLC